MLSSKTLPECSLRARSLTAPPRPILPPIPAARGLARRLDPPPLPSPLPSLPFPSLPIPLPSLRRLPIYLPPLLPYLPSPLPHAPLSPARPQAGVPTPASYTLPKAFFPPSPRPKPSQIQSALFSLFSFFMLIRRDSNPSPLCLPLCLPISCHMPIVLPAGLQIQWFVCVIHMQIKFLALIGWWN